MDSIYISICIPSYNRHFKIVSLVNDLLKSDNLEFEIIVLDNCSSDGTYEQLQAIKDQRLCIYRNEENIGGILNILKVLTLAHGRYAFLCLDKDFLEYKSIDKLICILKKEKDISFGYCSLNLGESAPNCIYDQEFSSIKNMAYLSSHPSGRFYAVDLYKKNDIVIKALQEKKLKFGFCLDIINARMALLGKSLLINIPSFFTENETECANTVTHTYSGSSIYFSPKARRYEYLCYLKDIDSLVISKEDKYALFKYVFERGFYSLLSYKSVMNNYYICAHHNISPKNITYFELFLAELLYIKSFIFSSLKLPYYTKMLICFKVMDKQLLKILNKKYAKK